MSDGTTSQQSPTKEQLIASALEMGWAYDELILGTEEHLGFRVPQSPELARLSCHRNKGPVGLFPPGSLLVLTKAKGQPQHVLYTAYPNGWTIYGGKDADFAPLVAATKAAAAQKAGRRLRRVPVSWEVLLGMLTLDGTKRLKASGVPADAKVAGVSADPANRECVVVLESATFEPVADGGPIPVLDVTFRELPQQGQALTIEEDAAWRHGRQRGLEEALDAVRGVGVANVVAGRQPVEAVLKYRRVVREALEACKAIREPDEEDEEDTTGMDVQPDHVVVRVGTFEADVSAAGLGTVKLDGREVPGCAGFTVKVEAGEVSRVTLGVYPVETETKKATPKVDVTWSSTAAAKWLGSWSLQRYGSPSAPDRPRVYFDFGPLHGQFWELDGPAADTLLMRARREGHPDATALYEKVVITPNATTTYHFARWGDDNDLSLATGRRVSAPVPGGGSRAAVTEAPQVARVLLDGGPRDRDLYETTVPMPPVLHVPHEDEGQRVRLVYKKSASEPENHGILAPWRAVYEFVGMSDDADAITEAGCYADFAARLGVDMEAVRRIEKRILEDADAKVVDTAAEVARTGRDFQVLKAAGAGFTPVAAKTPEDAQKATAANPPAARRLAVLRGGPHDGRTVGVPQDCPGYLVTPDGALYLLQPRKAVEDFAVYAYLGPAGGQLPGEQEPYPVSVFFAPEAARPDAGVRLRRQLPKGDAHA